MAKLLFRMRHVPDDEAAEVRELLDEHDIRYFETHAGNWGISFPGIWLEDDAQYELARRLLDEYQSARSSRIKAEYELQKSLGQAPTMWHSFVENPWRFVAYFTLITAVLYFSLSYFLGFL